MRELHDGKPRVTLTAPEREAIHSHALALLSGIDGNGAGLPMDELRDLLRALDEDGGETLELAILHPERMRSIFTALRERAERTGHLSGVQEAMVRRTCGRVLTAIDGAGD